MLLHFGFETPKLETMAAWGKWLESVADKPDYAFSALLPLAVYRLGHCRKGLTTRHRIA